MTTIESAAPAHGARRDVTTLCAVMFTATSFLSALLLFCIEPMFSKMVLPVLGGTSAVWSVAMVVFQGLLLAGYVYAWAITKWLSLRAAMLLHLGLLLAASFCLPVAISALLGEPPSQNIALWLIALFLTSIGLPFFAVAANAPLLQAWFARTSDANARNAYFLYRASNFGSFMVLLAYPLAIEPVWGLASQSRLWSMGYALLALGIAACAALTLSSGVRANLQTQTIAMARSGIRWRDRGAWMLLGLIPSGLLVAVTAHISTDVASAPFLWIAPLALYLLTFVLAFTDKPLIPLKWLIAVQPITIVALAFMLLWDPVLNWGLSLFGHLATFFVAALLCHTLLFRRRPPAGNLTEFYVWMSLGGVLGGIFAALIAPAIFNTVLEYPLLVLAAFAMRPDLRGRAAKDWITDIGFVLAIAVTLGAGYFAVNARSPELGLKFYATCVITVTMILPFLMRRPILIVSLSAILFLVTSFYPPGQDIVYRGRSFFGVYKVLNKDDGAYHVFFHGTTTHGTEQVRDANGKPVTGPPAPLAYYYRGGALGNATEAVRAAHALNHVAVVGLGVGAMSCYRQPGEAWTFYELDPLVVRIATDRKLFRSFSTCAPHAPVVLGDARLTLKTAPRGTDLLILDAFTSDSVPVHLLTKEAFALYKSKLSPHGVIVFHISNRNLELADVVAASAAANGMAVAVHMGHAPTNAHRMVTAPEVAVVAQSAADLAGLKLDAGWKPRAAPAGFRVWTDDYSNILGVLLQRLAG
jgi:hypothetical protein